MATRTNTKKREINLDVLEAQDREAQKTAPTLKFKGKAFTLPVELPWAVVESYGELMEIPEEERTGAAVGQMIRVVKAMLGDSYDDFAALNPTAKNVNALIGEVFALYGTSSGESLASGNS